MLPSDPMEVLLLHNLWATRHILQTCEKLSDEQLHRRFEMGRGSLHDTTLHMIQVVRGWGDLLAGREFVVPNPNDRKTVAEQLVMLEQVSDDFTAIARKYPTAEMVTRERGGKTYSFSRGGVVTHVMTHGMHHRAQCLNMLRQVGVNPLPTSSVVEWMIAGGQ